MTYSSPSPLSLQAEYASVASVPQFHCGIRLCGRLVGGDDGDSKQNHVEEHGPSSPRALTVAVLIVCRDLTR